MILLKNCYYIATFDDSDNELQGYDILIKNNVIEKIGKNIELSPDETESAEIIDCSRYLVVPGMVNTHPFTNTVWSAGPAGIDQPACCLMFQHFVLQHFRIIVWVMHHKRRSEAS